MSENFERRTGEASEVVEVALDQRLITRESRIQLFHFGDVRGVRRRLRRVGPVEAFDLHNMVFQLLQ